MAQPAAALATEEPVSESPPQNSERPAHRRTAERPSARFRGDVEGLRAIAVGLVVLYHTGLSFLPGGFVGVDVFFVISGFLITTQLASEVNRTGRISLPAFYARRAKRLLPAAGTVLVASAAIVYFYLPPSSWADHGGDIVGAALYMVNWRFADRAVDYLAEGNAPSVVQHFWSLAVEEQYYIVWPLLILLAVALARAVRRDRAVIMAVSLATLIAASFAYSIWATADSPQRAFFITTTRMWELGIGAAVALAAGLCARLPRVLGAAMTWLGLAAVVASGVIITTDTAWPGYAAALPVLGSAAVIAGGFAAGRGGAGLVLGVRPMRWVGGLSYSLYLWHWPFIVAAVSYWGEDATTKRLLVVAAASVVPAWLAHVLVENPFRHSKPISRSPRLALSMGANFTLVGVATGLAVLAAATASSTAAPPPADAPGARILAANPRNDPHGAPVDVVDWFTPTPLQAKNDATVAHTDGCVQHVNTAAVLSCVYGDPESRTTVAVAGDSKITQWIPALVPLAERNGWRMVTYLESGCPLANATTFVRNTVRTECRQWGKSVMERLRADPPDWVITSQLQGVALDESGQSTQDAMVKGLRDTWSDLRAMGAKVVVIADNPGPGSRGNVFECVEKHPRKLTECAFDRTTTTNAAGTQRTAAEGQAGVFFVDLTDAICPTDRCAPVIGNVLIYQETSHITSTYIRTLAPRLAAALTDVGLKAEPPHL